MSSWVFGQVVQPTGRRRLKVTLSFLNDRELEQLREELESERDRRDENEARKEQELARRTVVGISAAQERVRCGTKGCHCADGQLHGPYWYARITTGDGRTRKRYIGNAAKWADAIREAERKARASGLLLKSESAPYSSTRPRPAARTR